MHTTPEKFHTLDEAHRIVGNPSGAAASPKQILEFCNKVRQAGGVEVLESLLPGIRIDDQSCLIAANLNFKCTVQPYIFKLNEKRVTPETAYDVETGVMRWVMVINSTRLLEKIASSLNLRIVSHYQLRHSGSLTQQFQTIKAILLPLEIGAAAEHFDNEGYEEELYTDVYQP